MRRRWTASLGPCIPSGTLRSQAPCQRRRFARLVLLTWIYDTAPKRPKARSWRYLFGFAVRFVTAAVAAVLREFEAICRGLLVFLGVVIASLAFLTCENDHDAVLFFCHFVILERAGRHEKDGHAVRSVGDHTTAAGHRQATSAKSGTVDKGALTNACRVPLENDAAYTCPRCAETNYIAVDPSGGRRQQFVEDCPVCCHPIDFLVTFDREGDAIVERVELAT